MLSNYESKPYVGKPESGFRGGLNITDVTDPANPKHIYFWECDGSGVHRFSFDGRYRFISLQKLRVT